jgi:RNA polymerase sigma factor (sigma-70 family)
MYNTVKIVNMEENIVLSSARKAVTARLAALGRRFSADDINEMVSLTVERFYTKGHYDSDKSSIKTYVSQIAFRVVYDFVKSVDKNCVRYIRLDDVKDSESCESYMDFTERDLRFADPKGADYDILRKEHEDGIELAKSKLSDRDRRIYELICKGLSYSEIAMIIGLTPQAVTIAAFRMRRQMRGNFGEAA